MSKTIKHSNERFFDAFFYILMLCTFSMQNKTTLNIILINIGSIRLNIFDGVISFCLLLLFFRTFYILKRKFTLLEWNLLFLFLAFLIIGVINNNEIAAIIYNSRAYLYLLFVLVITRNLKGDAYFFYKVLNICSLLCTSIYFFTYFTVIRIGELSRFVDFNFSIILLNIAFSIYYFNNNKVNYYSLINILFGIIAIFTTQTRTLIIPLCIILFIFLLSNMLYKKVSLLSRTVILVFFTMLIYLTFFTNLNEIAFNRFEKIESTKESTLDLRINSFIYNYGTMDPEEKILGGGLGREILYYSNFNNVLGDSYNLELFFGEYILKYGYLGTFILTMIFFQVIMRNWKAVNKLFLLTILLVLLFLSISGLSGYTGHFYLGLILGLISNRNLWSTNHVTLLSSNTRSMLRKLITIG